jgi:hypothetical protein
MKNQNHKQTWGNYRRLPVKNQALSVKIYPFPSGKRKKTKNEKRAGVVRPESFKFLPLCFYFSR